MKLSLWKEIRTYSKTKGLIPLDERQMDALKELYLELAKSMILGCMVFIVTYGFMDMRGQTLSINFMNLAICLLGAITYDYTIRFCYLNVIGLDANFEILLVPAMLFTPCLFFYTGFMILQLFILPPLVYLLLLCCLPLFFILAYLGLNRVYQNGKQQLEQEIKAEELHFRSRRQIVNYVIIAASLINFLPISYDLLFKCVLVLTSLLLLYHLYLYGFKTPMNDYILNEEGLRYKKALWGKKGGFLRYEDIQDIRQQDTFNIGYSKDKVHILCKDGRSVYLFPENSYRFCVEIKQFI